MVEALYQGRKRKVHTGSRGGKYVVVQGTKRYLKAKKSASKKKPVKKATKKCVGIPKKKKVVKRKPQKKKKPAKRKTMKGGGEYVLSSDVYPVFSAYANEYFPGIKFILYTKDEGDIIGLVDKNTGDFLYNATSKGEYKGHLKKHRTLPNGGEFLQGYRFININYPGDDYHRAKICPVKGTFSGTKANSVISQNNRFLFPALSVDSTKDALEYHDVQLALVMCLTCDITVGRRWKNLSRHQIDDLFRFSGITRFPNVDDYLQAGGALPDLNLTINSNKEKGFIGHKLSSAGRDRRNSMIDVELYNHDPKLPARRNFLGSDYGSVNRARRLQEAAAERGAKKVGARERERRWDARTGTIPQGRWSRPTGEV
jgi:hypothetical protein